MLRWKTEAKSRMVDVTQNILEYTSVDYLLKKKKNVINWRALDTN